MTCFVSFFDFLPHSDSLPEVIVTGDRVKRTITLRNILGNLSTQPNKTCDNVLLFLDIFMQNSYILTSYL